MKAVLWVLGTIAFVAVFVGGIMWQENRDWERFESRCLYYGVSGETCRWAYTFGPSGYNWGSAIFDCVETGRKESECIWEMRKAALGGY